MTRSEAIEFAKEQQEIFGGKMGEFLKFVEDALTQTTGDDLISRADVLALAKDVTLEGGAKHRCIDATMIHELPSAERRGKWIVRAETFGKRTLYYYTCPLCGNTKHERTNYCPDCGAKMKGDKDA